MYLLEVAPSVLDAEATRTKLGVDVFRAVRSGQGRGLPSDLLEDARVELAVPVRGHELRDDADVVA